MKNLFLAIIFSLIGSFVFASNSAQQIETTYSIERNLNDLKHEVFNVNTIHVTLSCGIEVDIVNFTGTIEELLNLIWQLDALLCGGTEVPVIE